MHWICLCSDLSPGSFTKHNRWKLVGMGVGFWIIWARERSLWFDISKLDSIWSTYCYFLYSGKMLENGFHEGEAERTDSSTNKVGMRCTVLLCHSSFHCFCCFIYIWFFLWGVAAFSYADVPSESLFFTFLYPQIY